MKQRELKNSYWFDLTLSVWLGARSSAISQI